MSEIKDRLKELRKALNLKQREVAEKLGVRVGDVGGWESGRHVPDSRLRLLCHEYNVRREWLETGEGEMFEPEKAPKSEDEILEDACAVLFNRLDEQTQLAVLRVLERKVAELKGDKNAPQPADEYDDFSRDAAFQTVADARGLDDGARNA